jgi:capsule biosynthesis phosphatase
MILIIPLGGTGERFKKNGYKNPKALIKVFGKPILYYLLDHLNLSKVDMICIPYNKEYLAYDFENRLTRDYPSIKFQFILLENNTGGAAETLNIALRTFTCEDSPVLCLDGDNFYTTDVVQLWNGKNRIMTFQDTNEASIYSYLQLMDQKVVDIVEKQKISDHACSGAYGFSSYKELLTYTQKVLDQKLKQKGEYYTSTVIKEMIKDGFSFEVGTIHIQHYHCLGTPIQLKYFYNNYPKCSSLTNGILIKKQRICFDLDNTLVSSPKNRDDYSSVLPMEKNIKFLRYLKTFGHTIIIYTARRMRTHHGNVGKILCDIGKITFDTLEKFEIPFDEIYFGKPYADVYIDDLALNCHDPLEKELGYYMDTIKPRDFNELEQNVIETYTKKSDDLSGEIYYYRNIPSAIKDLFPVLIDYDIDNRWYKIEKIHGLTLTNMYLNELLTEDTLLHVMKSIQRIQKTETNDMELQFNIYDNYAKKLKSRYTSYDYSRFHNSRELFDQLYFELTEYEKNQKGKCSVIHGDTVMTNILINQNGKIKFIDMRGKLGDQLTLCGDYLYDWAKLYQSLIGYDSILLETSMKSSYAKHFIDTFETYFTEMYSLEELQDLKLITKSLLFSLIPLHDNEKCYKYYNLIQTF